MFVLIKIALAFFLLFSTYSQGVQFYNYHSQRCCEGKVHDLNETDRSFGYDCCGTELYQYELKEESPEFKRICCQGKIYLKVNRSAECCGTKVFEKANQACHQLSEEEFDVVPLPQDNINNGETEVCRKSKNEIEFYRLGWKECCSGVLNERQRDMQCCGDAYINTTVSKCCVDLVKDDEKRPWKIVKSVIHNYDVIPIHSECCNRSVIDADKQGCCAGVVVDLPNNFSYAFTNDILMVYLHNDLDVLHPYCCGSHLITNEETQVCVDRKHVMYREHKNQVYCGGQWHNISDEEPLNVYCIKDEVLELKGSEYFCSVNGTNIKYDATNGVCAENQLIHKPADGEARYQSDVCYKSMYFNIHAGLVFPNLAYRPPVRY